MKKALAVLLAGFLTAGFLGCSSDSSKSSKSSSTSSVKKNSGTSVDSNQTKSSDDKNPDVNLQTSKTKLINKWPDEIPIMEGTITYSASANVIGKDSKPTGELQFTTSVDTKKTNQEVYDFYKSKLAKVTQEGTVDESRSFCAGTIGEWEISVSSVTKDEDKGISSVTVGIQPKK